MTVDSREREEARARQPEMSVPSVCVASNSLVGELAIEVFDRMRSGQPVGVPQLVSVKVGCVLLQETGDLSGIRGLVSLGKDMDADGVWVRMYLMDELRVILVDRAERDSLSAKVVENALVEAWGEFWWGALCCGFYSVLDEDLKSMARRVGLLAHRRSELQSLRYEWGAKVFPFEALIRRRFDGLLAMWSGDSTLEVFEALALALNNASLADEDEQHRRAAQWLLKIVERRQGCRAIHGSETCRIFVLHWSVSIARVERPSSQVRRKRLFRCCIAWLRALFD